MIYMSEIAKLSEAQDLFFGLNLCSSYAKVCNHLDLYNSARCCLSE